MSSYASPFPSEGYPTASSDSVIELSRKFNQASLQSHCRNLFYDAPPSKVPDVNSTRVFDRRISSANNSHLTRQQRPTMAQRHCKSAHFLKMNALLEDMLTDNQTCDGTSHSSSRACNSFSQLPAQQPVTCTPSPSTNPFPMSASSSEIDETDSYRGSKRQCEDRISNDSRPSSMESVSRKNIVLRSIRVRRSFHKRRSLESGKRCDR